MSSSDELLQKGIVEMEDDLKLQPQDRTGNIGQDFLEVYESIIPVDQDSTPDTMTPEPSPAPIQKKKKEKRKRKLTDDCHADSVYDGEASTEGSKPNQAAIGENDANVAAHSATIDTAAPSSEKIYREGKNKFRMVIDEEKKRLFEEKKEEIMRTVPKAVKKRFGEIVFATFGSFIGPVLILDPYRISPGPVRNQWLKMYQKVSQSKRIFLHCLLTLTRVCMLDDNVLPLLSTVQIYRETRKHDQFSVLVWSIRQSRWCVFVCTDIQIVGL
jgi:hypothetical protein